MTREAWRPIAEAPSSGAYIFGWSQRAQGCEYVGQPDWRVCTGRMLHGRVYLDGPSEGSTSVKVSHFMPLPAPPEKRGDGE
jgi:hypothetical protein